MPPAVLSAWPVAQVSLATPSAATGHGTPSTDDREQGVEKIDTSVRWPAAWHGVMRRKARWFKHLWRTSVNAHASCNGPLVAHLNGLPTMFDDLSRHSWRHLLASLALAASAGTASAAVYTGSWDPAYGPAFPNLGWRGEARFFVPDACIARGPGIYRATVPGPGWSACEDSRVLGAMVELYNLADPVTTLHTLLFPGSRFDPPDLVAIGLDGEFAGLRTDFALPPVLVTDAALLGTGTFAFSVRFNKDDVLPIGTTRLNHRCVADCGVSPPDGTSASDPNLSLQRVPTPGTLALVLTAGVAGIGVSGRLRRRRTAG